MKRIFIISLILLIYPLVIFAVDEQKFYDLAIESITVTPSTPAVNQKCKITVVGKNKGTIGLVTTAGAGSFNYIFNNFKVTNLSYTTPSSNNIIKKNGGTLIYDFEGYFTKAGEHNLYFMVNYDNGLAETKIHEDGYSIDLYEDNALSKKIIVVEDNLVDIEVLSVEVNLEKPIIDEEVKITAKLKNTGKSSITEERFFSESQTILSADNFNLRSSDYPALPSLGNPIEPGETYQIIYTGAFFNKGTKNFSVQYDKSNILKEMNENNNATSSSVYVYLDKNEANQFSFKNINVYSISSSSVKIVWETDKKTTGKVLYRRVEFVHNIEKVSGTNDIVHNVEIQNLTPSKTYNFQIVGESEGVEKYSDMTIHSLPADVPKITINPTTTINIDNVTVNWTTDTLTMGGVYYRKKGEQYKEKIDNSEYANNHSIELNGLYDGNYEYFVVSTSTPGVAAESAVKIFKIGYVEPEIKKIEKKESPIDKGDENDSTDLENSIQIRNHLMYNSLKGKIVLKVESKGEAYYINPKSETMHYLGRPEDAFGVMREQGVGISTRDLEKIEIGFTSLSGVDTDGDGLSDMFEDAIGTDKNKKDSDDDGFEDKTEAEGGYNPKGSGQIGYDNNFAKNHYGKIFLQVEDKGEAWYVSPSDGKRYFLGRPGDAFSVMRNLGLGISNSNFDSL